LLLDFSEGAADPALGMFRGQLLAGSFVPMRAQVTRRPWKSLIMTSMRQSFCYGYGIGKFEGNTNERVYL